MATSCQGRTIKLAWGVGCGQERDQCVRVNQTKNYVIYIVQFRNCMQECGQF